MYAKPEEKENIEKWNCFCILCVPIPGPLINDTEYVCDPRSTTYDRRVLECAFNSHYIHLIRI